MRRDTVTAKDSLRSDWISIGDCEHFPGASQLVRTLPTGCRTYENVCPHRHASNPLLEETFLQLVSSSLFRVLIETLALVATLDSQLVFVWCNAILRDTNASRREDAEVSVRGSGSGNRRAQVKQVSVR